MNTNQHLHISPQTGANPRVKILGKTILLSLLFIFCLSGCSRNNALTLFQQNMDEYLKQIHFYDEAINAIDPQSDTAVDDLLNYLNGIATLISQLAVIDVPSEYQGIHELALEASEFMEDVLRLFGEAFAGEFYDDELGETANDYYQRVNLRLRYIAAILQGEDVDF